jgi:hypothetical protein
MHDTIQARTRRTRPRRTGAAALTASAAATVTAVLLAACSPTSHTHVAAAATTTTPGRPGSPGTTTAPTNAPGNTGSGAVRPAAFLLHPYTSCTDLLAGLRSHAAASVGPYGFDGGVVYASEGVGAGTAVAAAVPGAMAPDTQKSSASTSTGTDTSTTNVQEQGVDEPDIVKTDGGRVLVLSSGHLHVLDAATRTVTATLDLTVYAGWQNAQLLAAGRHVIAILPADSGTGVAYSLPVAMPAGGYPAPVQSTASRTTVLFIDLDPAPVVTGMLRADGGYLDARMIGTTVRLVQRSGPTLVFPQSATGTDAQRTARNRGIIRSAPLSAWQPTYSISSGTSVTNRTVDCGQISHPADYTGTSLLTVYTLDLDHLDTPATPVAVAADGDTVYATATSLYVVSNASCPFCAPVQHPTQIHRFDITGNAPPRYLGSGTVPGSLLSQYSLSDYAGHLRVAVTITAPVTATPTNSVGALPTAPVVPGGPIKQGSTTNSVYVLDDATLAVTGHVDGLGVGERLYAVRFVGALGYVVTFQNTDPLYVIDLHDPHAPRAVGTLQLTGYSDYLHDVGGGRLLGVGQSVHNGVVAGLQLSLFDIRNPAAPALLARAGLPGAPDESALDPHAFLYWPATGLVVVPVSSWVGGTNSPSGSALVLRVDGVHLNTVGTLRHPDTDPSGIERSLIVDGQLWTVSAGGVSINAETTLASEAWLPLS